MDLVTAILNGNEEKFNELVKTVDINFTTSGFTLLWIAINGTTSRPKDKNNEFANCNMVATLLDRGADPNKKCVLMTPLYSAVFHNRTDVARLLLLRGANPNEFSMIKCMNRKLLFETPLHLAIRNADIETVKILLLHDVYYNKVTFERVLSGINKIKEDTCNTFNCQMLKILKAILNMLESNYQDSFEEKVNEIINKNPKVGKLPHYYSCFQKLPQTNQTKNTTITKPIETNPFVNTNPTWTDCYY